MFLAQALIDTPRRRLASFESPPSPNPQHERESCPTPKRDGKYHIAALANTENLRNMYARLKMRPTERVPWSSHQGKLALVAFAGSQRTSPACCKLPSSLRAIAPSLLSCLRT